MKTIRFYREVTTNEGHDLRMTDTEYNNFIKMTPEQRNDYLHNHNKTELVSDEIRDCKPVHCIEDVTHYPYTTIQEDS